MDKSYIYYIVEKDKSGKEGIVHCSVSHTEAKRSLAQYRSRLDECGLQEIYVYIKKVEDDYIW
jgi:hypothetical protein